MILKTTAIIVTYSDRFHLLKKVIDACIIEGVLNIVVVDNNSCTRSKKQLLKLQSKNNSKIHVIWNNQNEGSSSAFKKGLKYVLDKRQYEYIWLLDDDNKPEKDSLKLLHNYWRSKDKDVECLLSYRPDREIYKEAVLRNKPNLVLSKPNSFFGFSLNEKLLKPLSRKILLDNNIRLGSIAYATYGGMFFHKTLVNKIGFPDEKLFLYSDDHDWSYRITRQNKKIILLLDSVVQDIDQSWAIFNKKTSIFQKIKKGSAFRIYYTIRNRMVFEKKYIVTNSMEYFINRKLFALILFFYCGNNQKFRIFLLAMKHAKNYKLGKTFEGTTN